MKAITFAVLLVLAPAAGFAQQWEFGADGGVGLFNHVAVSSPFGSATAGFAPGFTAGAYVGENISSHFSGEIRYEYMQSDLRLSSGGQNADFSGGAHAIHYDMVYRTNRGESPVQFFAAVGGGVKAFVGTGSQEAYQPLSQYGYFTKTNSLKMMVTGAAGLTFKMSPTLSLRMEVRDFSSAFPTAVLTPPQGVKYGSMLNEVVPMVSIVYAK
jgi:Outer membrane protein beta-barrel domain